MTRTPRLRRTAAVLIPLLLVAVAFPAFGILGLGEVGIIANQAIQIAAQVTQVAEAIQTYASLEDQLSGQVAQALGQVGALIDTFEQLASDPMSLLDNFQSVAWGTDFTADPRELLESFTDMQDPNADPLTDYWRQYLAQADTVSRGRMDNLFSHVPGNRASDIWLNSRERAERAQIFDFASLDSAERMTELLGNAAETFERTRQQTNLADTALAQEQLANQLTIAEIILATAQLDAQIAVREAMDRQTRELARLRQLEAWTAELPQQRQRVQTFSNATRGRATAYSDALRLN